MKQVLKNLKKKAELIISKCEVVVMGPGLSGVPDEEGRTTATQQAALLLLDLCMQQEKFLVIDADMIRILSLPVATAPLRRMRGYRRCMYTPNKREFDLLLGACDVLRRESEREAAAAVLGFPSSDFPNQLQQLQQQVLQLAQEEEQQQQQYKTEEKKHFLEKKEKKEHCSSEDASSSATRFQQSEASHIVALPSLPSTLLPAAAGLAALPLLLTGPHLFLKGSTDVFVVLANSSSLLCCSGSSASASSSTSSSSTSSSSAETGCTYTAVLGACGPAACSGSAWGSPKRSGGQGDLLNGVLAAFISWFLLVQKKERQQQQQQRATPAAGLIRAVFGVAGAVTAATAKETEKASAEVADDLAAAVLCAAFNASLVVRTAAARTFQRKSRGILAEDILEDIAPTFAALYDSALGYKPRL